MRYSTLLVTKFLVVLLCLSATVAVQAQTDAKITDIQVTYDTLNDQVDIAFQLSDLSKNEALTVKVEGYKTVGGEWLKMNTLFGDTGNIAGNGLKKISWNQRMDGYTLEEEIGIKLSAYNELKVPITNTY